MDLDFDVFELAEIYECIRTGKMTVDQFRDWYFERYQEAVSEGAYLDEPLNDWK